MSLGVLMRVSMVQGNTFRDEVQLGGHAEHHAPEVSVQQLVVLVPEVEEVLQYVVIYFQLD